MEWDEWRIIEHLIDMYDKYIIMTTEKLFIFLVYFNPKQAVSIILLSFYEITYELSIERKVTLR